MINYVQFLLSAWLLTGAWDTQIRTLLILNAQPIWQTLQQVCDRHLYISISYETLQTPSMTSLSE